MSDERIASQIGGPGSVSGAVFTDVNSNGALDGTDITLANISVYVDFNNNGILDGTEPSSVTNNSGTYNISNLSPGTYTVRQIVQPGLSQVNPDPVVSLSLASPAATQINFVNTPGAPIGPGNVNTITGIIFNDTNFNGLRDNNENGIEGIQVYLDSNNNSIFDNNEALIFTDNIGSYTFGNLAPGVYNVKQIANPPSTETSRSPVIFFNNQPQTVVVDLGNAEVKNVGSVSGFKYFDANGNSLRDVGEPGIANYTIYADVNGNGYLDSNEPFTLTGNDGSYVLPNLPASHLIIREVKISGVSQTNTSPVVDLTNCDNLTEINFGNTPLNIITGEIRGFVFNDANRDGIIDPGATGIPNVPLFLDANNNNIFDPAERVTNTNAVGNYSFPQVTPGYYVLRQVPVAGLDKITPDPVVGITPENLVLPAVNFANSPSIVVPPVNTNTPSNPSTTPPGPVGPSTTTTRTASQVAPGVNQIGGVVFNDINGNGLVEANEGGLSGFTTYLDTNNNGTLDSNEPSTITDPQGQYRFTGLPVGTYVVQAVPQTGFNQSTPDPVITIDAGVNANFVNIGFSGGPVGPTPVPPSLNIPSQLIPTPGNIVGTKFNDLNGNGFPEPNDPVVPGIPIYLDINNNGIGEVNEPFTVTNSAGSYQFTNIPAGTYRVREQLAPGVTQTTVDPAVVVTPGQTIVYNFGNSTVFGEAPYSSSISGVVYEDTNDNNVYDAGDFGFAGHQVYIDLNANGFLDPDEASTNTNERGEYIFRAVPPGTYNIRQNILPGQNGQIEQVSVNPGPVTIVVPNDNPSGINFENAFKSIQANTVSGIKFNDLNANKFYEPFAGEAPIPGVEIFLDLNNDGQLQGFEPNQITGPDGSYGLSLDHVEEGQYVLREVDRGGFYQTTPLTTIDYVTGESYVYNFGNAPQSTISGTVFNDLNGNGFPDNGEKELFGVPNVQVYIDSDYDGFLDNNEISTFSAVNGAYAFVGLNAPGTYPVRTVNQPNIFQTTPIADITVGLGQNITYDIGNNVVPVTTPPVVPTPVDPNTQIVV